MEIYSTDIKHQIRRFVIEEVLFGEDSDLTDETSFLEKGILDSTGVLELVAFLEKTFDIKIADTELLPDNLDSIKAAEEFVRRKMNDAK
jgi:acyl carrier protein